MSALIYNENIAVRIIFESFVEIPSDFGGFRYFPGIIDVDSHLEIEMRVVVKREMIFHEMVSKPFGCYFKRLISEFI